MENDTTQPALAASQESKQVVSLEAAPIIEQDLIDIEHFAKVKLRVAQIESVESIPKSKKLLKLQVNLGEKLGKRQVLAGIAQYYKPEDLIGKRIVVVANLKPATLMGETSQGMLLAASNEDGNSLCILEPDNSIELGSTVR